MDLTVDIDHCRLNIRVAVLVRTAQGFLFERGKDGYYFALGGRVKANESSMEAAKREIFEEIGIQIEDMQLVSIIENFFEHRGRSVHEICFVYASDRVLELSLPDDMVAFGDEGIEKQDIRPGIIRKIISNRQSGISHFIRRS